MRQAIALAAGAVLLTGAMDAMAAGAAAAAQALLDATPPVARVALQQRFTEEARSDWHYTPRRRDGIADHGRVARDRVMSDVRRFPIACQEGRGARERAQRSGDHDGAGARKQLAARHLRLRHV